MPIPPDSIREIKEQADFLGLLGANADLRPTGPGRWATPCVFHEDGSRSLHIDVVRVVYYCVHCERHGDAITFLFERDGLSVEEAVAFLAIQAGLTVRSDDGHA